VAELQAWSAGNVEALAVATVEDRLLDAVSNTILAYARSIRSLSDTHGVPFALAEWVAGRSFATIHNLLVRKRCGLAAIARRSRMSSRYSKMALAMMSPWSSPEPLDPALRGALALLQRQVKKGLTEKAALAFLEAGFADRVVATALGQAWPGVLERDGVQSAGTNARPFRLFSAGCRLILPRSPPSARLDSGSHLSRTVSASRAQDECAS
jgi:hypothetical protein